MNAEILGVAVMAAMLAAPLLIERYLRQLPPAPACPDCRAVARAIIAEGLLTGWVPEISRTFLAECSRCGWRGRMRWRYATRAARKDGG
jgi:hypothetical protein